ncbi:MAG TPA: alkaline phosphatase family protein [Byssovorax sp.]|jgi:phospholipase C
MRFGLVASVFALAAAAAACSGAAQDTGGSSEGGGLLTGAGGGSSRASTSASVDVSSTTVTSSSRSSTASSSGHGGGAATTGAGGSGGAFTGTRSNIKRVVIIVQENHTFDAYFGAYCTAAPGSSPTCTAGPACCEAAPSTDPMGVAPTVLDDAENGNYDPDHEQACELDEIDGGLMDRFTSGASCSDDRNFAVAPADVVQAYHDLATDNALADRYFQPIAGQSSSNDMYLAVADYVFTDNDEKPDTNGSGCDVPGPSTLYQGKTTIADLLLGAGHTFGFFAEGYQAMMDTPFCPFPPSDCPWGLPTTPCDYDPADVPFQYYSQFADNLTYMRDLGDFVAGVPTGDFPEVSFVKGVGYHNEHPGYSTNISQGVTFVSDLVAAIAASPAADETLVLVTWDEGGGFFDHVPPPPDSAVDGQPYGTRVPLLVVGRFAQKGVISHVQLEHSSILRFLEWNFLGATGQLGARDAAVANLGSLLDPAETGAVVPAD